VGGGIIRPRLWRFSSYLHEKNDVSEVRSLAKVVVLTGNGLSIALNPEFSIPRITEKFFMRLPTSIGHLLSTT
jgi:hypothetical protein